MTASEILVALAIAVGVAGVLVPVLPGLLLVLLAIGAWAVQVGGATAWAVFAVAAAFLAAGTVLKYAVPGRRMRAGGVPRTTLLTGAALAVVGFFVVPVVGLLLGFVAGVYLAEHRRVGGRQAWPSTRAALAAVGLSILIELAAALLAAATWAVGLVLT